MTDPRSSGQVAGVDHVQLAMPSGEAALADATRFYGELLGLHEVPKPARLQANGGLWFAGPSTALHLGVEPQFRPARKAHPALLVDGLEVLLARLAEAGIGVTPDDAIPGIRRAYVHDPFGNRIELIEAADGGFTDPSGRS